MKIRNGFVSNSSSSSFVITQEPPESIANWFTERIISPFENEIYRYLSDYGRGYYDDDKFVWCCDDEREMWESFDHEQKVKIALLAGWVDDYPEEKDLTPRREWSGCYDDSYQNPPIAEVLGAAGIKYEYERF
ncbi:hypothetical protein VPHD479_0110 [Vibrio phage D479]